MNSYLLINLNQKYWPTAPNGYDSTFKLMNKLSHRSKVICTLEAIKMTIHLWKEYEFNDLSMTILRKTTIKAIETIEKWLEGNATEDEVTEDINSFNGHLDVAYIDDPEYPDYIISSFFAFEYLINKIFIEVGNYESLNASDKLSRAIIKTIAILAASTARVVTPTRTRLVTPTKVKYDEFYSEWWTRCYPFIQLEFQDTYNLLIKNINGDT